MTPLPSLSVDCHAEYRSVTGIAEECGDIGFAEWSGKYCFLALFDGLGHGPEAHHAALEARKFLGAVPDVAENGPPLADLIAGIHKRLLGTRGVVAGLCRIDLATGLLRYVGIGDISAKIFGRGTRRLISRDGIVGYSSIFPKEGEDRLEPGEIMVLTSDGIKDHLDPEKHPDLLDGTSRDIAIRLISSFRKDQDDASCIVMRYRR